MTMNPNTELNTIFISFVSGSRTGKNICARYFSAILALWYWPWA